MALNTDIVEHEYQPGSANAPEAIPFQYLAAADIEVTHLAAATGVRTVLTIDSDYVIAGDGGAGSGTITSVGDWPAGDKFLLRRRTPIQQDAVVLAHQPLPSKDVSRQLDRQAMALQEHGADIADTRTRGLMVPIGETAPEMASLAGSDGKALMIVDGKIVAGANDVAGAEQIKADVEQIKADVIVDRGAVAGDKAAVVQLKADVIVLEQQAAAHVQNASNQADRAELAADGAFAGDTIYEDAAEGNAAVVDGDNFIAVGETSNDFIDLWTRTGAGANSKRRSMYSSTALTPAVQVSASAPTYLLPACWTGGYWWRKPRGTVIRDFIGSNHVDLTTAFPNGYAFDGDGWLVSANQGGKLPAQAHKGQLHVFEVEEGGGTGYYFATSTGKAAGKGQVGGLATWTKIYGVHGWGPHQVLRRGDSGGTGGYEFEGGGVIGIAAVAADNPSGQPVLSAANSALSGKASWVRHIVSLYAGTEPTDADISAAANFLRADLAYYHKWLRVEDCPFEAIPVFAFGESTDTSTLFAAATANFAGDVMTVIGFNGAAPRALEAGHALKASANADLNQYVVAQLTSSEPDGAMGKRGTYRVSWAPAVTGNQAVYYPDMTVAQQNQRANNVRVVARNNNSSGTTGISMDRLTMRPPYDNQAAPNVKSVAPKSGWAYGFVRAANEAPDDGRFYDLVFVSQGSTQDCPGGTEAAQTTSTNYVNANGGTTNVTAALSRNVKNLVSSGMFGSLLNRNVSREEQRSRKRGVGYTVVHWVKSWGLNTAFIGTGAVPDAATPLQWLEDDRAYIITYHGIADPQQTIVDPHEPDGNGDGLADGILGGDPDYPVGAVGTNRLTALGYERAAGTSFQAAHATSIDRIDGNSIPLNSRNGDPVHPEFAGYDALGGRIHSNVFAKRNKRTSAVF